MSGGYLLRGRNECLPREFVTGKDEIILFRSEGFAQNDSVQARDVSRAGRQNFHWFNMAQVIIGRLENLSRRRFHYHASTNTTTTTTTTRSAAGVKSGRPITDFISCRLARQRRTRTSTEFRRGEQWESVKRGVYRKMGYRRRGAATTKTLVRNKFILLFDQPTIY